SAYSWQAVTFGLGGAITMAVAATDRITDVGPSRQPPPLAAGAPARNHRNDARKGGLRIASEARPIRDEPAYREEPGRQPPPLHGRADGQGRPRYPAAAAGGAGDGFGKRRQIGERPDSLISRL